MPSNQQRRGGLRDLANSLNKKAASYEQQANEAAKDVAIAVVEHLAYNTPVDTTQALSNWIVTLGSGTDQTRLAFVPGMFGSTHNQSAQQTIQDAVNVLVNKKPGQTIFISNNLSYIRALNEGTISRQPSGFVEAAVLKGREVARNFKFKG